MTRNFPAVRMSMLLALVVTAVVTASAQAQVGSCSITSVTATNTGAYRNAGSFTFSCSGSLQWGVSTKLVFEDPARPVCYPVSGCRGTSYAEQSKDWPVMGTKCTVMPDGQSYCFEYVKQQQPSTGGYSMTVNTNLRQYTVRGLVTWGTGPCTVIGGMYFCPTKSVEITKESRYYAVGTE